MPIRLVRDYPYRQYRSRLWRAVRTLVGSVLLLVGLLATIVLLPAGFVTVSDILQRMGQLPADTIPPDIPVREIELAFAAALLVAFAGIRYGRRLVRGRRRMVLFLRRFGFQGSMQTVTYAVVSTIGATWRLVTLDDAAIAPVGVASGARLAFGIGGWLVRAGVRIGHGVIQVFPWLAWGVWGTLGVQIAQVVFFGDWRRAMNDGTIDAYTDAIASVMEGRIPVESFGVSLPGVFAIFLTALALGLGGLLVVMAALLLFFPFFGIVMLATSSAEALQKAEAAKTDAVEYPDQIRAAVGRVVEGGRQTFAPRLVVLRVADHAWRQTVSALAAVTAATIVDISEPSEHLLWELGELERLCPGRWIAIGEAARVERWANEPAPVADHGSLEARFAARLGSCQVLAYTTDRRGMRRFARALHGMLIDLEDG